MYKQALKEITRLVKSYKALRQDGSTEDIQELRDEISEQLFFFGPEYAEIRSRAEKAESDYKSCLETQKKYWKEKFGEKRGAVGLAENEAAISCNDAMDELNARNRDFYLAKSLMERSDQILNSLSSRLKIINKNE